jgi:hypothetical protein
MSTMDAGGGLAWALMLAALVVVLLVAAVALYWSIMPY